MSSAATTWVWRQSESAGEARLVLLAIADAAGGDGSHAWLSIRTIARMARTSTSAVRQRIAELEASDELFCSGGAPDDNGGRVRFLIPMPRAFTPIEGDHPADSMLGATVG